MLKGLRYWWSPLPLHSTSSHMRGMKPPCYSSYPWGQKLVAASMAKQWHNHVNIVKSKACATVCQERRHCLKDMTGWAGYRRSSKLMKCRRVFGVRYKQTTGDDLRRVTYLLPREVHPTWSPNLWTSSEHGSFVEFSLENNVLSLLVGDFLRTTLSCVLSMYISTRSDSRVSRVICWASDSGMSCLTQCQLRVVNGNFFYSWSHTDQNIYEFLNNITHSGWQSYHTIRTHCTYNTHINNNKF